jgi:pimeloyl-ACP methyl ester carboxylesterase
MSEPTPLTLSCGEVTLRGYDFGSRGKTPMVVAHGIQDFARALDPVALAFRDAYHVVSFDLRGHGDSDKPGVYTIPHFMADLHAVLQQLEFERPVLVGHSLGGQIVTQYAALWHDVPRAIVNIDGIGAPMREDAVPLDDRRYRLRNGVLSLLGRPREGRPMVDLEDAAQLFCRFHPGLDLELSRRLVAIGTEPHPHGGLRFKWDPQVLQIGIQGSALATEERYSWVECPALIITGGRAHEFFVRHRGLDPSLARSAPEEIARRVKLFRNPTHVEIAEAGHMIHLDAPDRLVEVMRKFL